MRPLPWSLPLLLAGSFVPAIAQNLENPDRAIPVVDASVSTVQSAGPLLATVLGELHNTTGNQIYELVIEARLTDAGGRIIDVISEPVDGLVVPAGQRVAFRLQAPAAAAAETYAGARVRVVSAQTELPAPPRPRPAPPSRIANLLMAWGPMLLLVVPWALIYRKSCGKGSIQSRMLAAVLEQTALLDRQVVALESLAAHTGPRGRAEKGE